MKKIIETIMCDICGKDVEGIKNTKYPVLFTTEQTEGRSCKPYISYQDIDLCPECLKNVIKIGGCGAQGYNKYKII